MNGDELTCKMHIYTEIKLLWSSI